jgi:translation elongation factor EF-G
MSVQVSTPERYYGVVLGDLAGSRSAEIQETIDPSGEDLSSSSSSPNCNEKLFALLRSASNQGEDYASDNGGEVGRRIIRSIAPLSLLRGYSSTLRSLTQGHATLSMQLHGYGQMSRERATQAVREIRGY